MKKSTAEFGYAVNKFPSLIVAQIEPIRSFVVLFLTKIIHYADGWNNPCLRLRDDSPQPWFQANVYKAQHYRKLDRTVIRFDCLQRAHITRLFPVCIQIFPTLCN